MKNGLGEVADKTRHLRALRNELSGRNEPIDQRPGRGMDMGRDL